MPVDLDVEVVCPPEEVELPGAEAGIDLRVWKASLSDQREQQLLGLRLRERRDVVEQGGEGLDAASAWVPGQDLLDVFDESLSGSLVVCALELPRRRDLGEVEKAAADVGDRNSLDRPVIAGVEGPGAVNDDALPASPVTGDGHMQHLPARRQQFPQLDRGPVTQQRAGAAGEYRAHLPGERRLHRVAYEVHAATEEMQASIP